MLIPGEAELHGITETNYSHYHGSEPLVTDELVLPGSLQLPHLHLEKQHGRQDNNLCQGVVVTSEVRAPVGGWLAG